MVELNHEELTYDFKGVRISRHHFYLPLSNLFVQF